MSWRDRWDGKRCQLCGRFANEFYGTGEDDGTTTYVDERCLTPAERGYFGLATDRPNRCYHPRSCEWCFHRGEACGRHTVGEPGHDRCKGTDRPDGSRG